MTLPRDLKGVYVITKIESTQQKYDKERKTVPKLFFENVKKTPNKPCLIFENITWTFQDVIFFLKNK